jgi:hypothetical protein
LLLSERKSQRERKAQQRASCIEFGWVFASPLGKPLMGIRQQYQKCARTNIHAIYYLSF